MTAKILLLFFMIVGCSVKEDGSTVPIDTDSTVQAEYKQQWLALTSTINFNGNRYTGEADIFGGGSKAYNFWFVGGELYDYMDEWPSSDENEYPLYYLYENGKAKGDGGNGESKFIDGNTAIVYMPPSADFGGKLVGSVYVLRLSNNTLYRTKNPKGFANLSSWDGRTADTNDLMVIGSKP